MPRATLNTEETVRRDLKSCPEGFVLLRRLSYGQKIQKRTMMSKMSIQSNRGSKDFAGEMQLINEQATMFDFSHCIVDHNLEDATGRKLNLASAMDFNALDPRIGEEIDKYLDELNNFEDEVDDQGKL